MPQDGSRSRHVRTDRDRPKCELVPRKQVARETEKERDNQQYDANTPIEFTRLLIGAGQENAEHVKHDSDNHAVRRPTVHVAQQHAKRDIKLQILDISKRVFRGRAIVKHEQNARDRRDKEHQEGNAAHAPRETEVDSVSRDTRWMQMQPHILEDLQRVPPPGVLVAVAKHRSPDLRIDNLFLESVTSFVHKIMYRQSNERPQNQ